MPLQHLIAMDRSASVLAGFGRAPVESQRERWRSGSGAGSAPPLPSQPRNDLSRSRLRAAQLQQSFRLRFRQRRDGQPGLFHQRHFFQPGGTPEQGKNKGNPNLHHGRWDQAFHPKGRNKRTVWSISLSKFREAHFAVFPEPLVETCVLAGCPDGGVVLDPFLGSGTTAVVAKRLGRKYIGIDCVAEFCEMARRRLREILC